MDFFLVKLIYSRREHTATRPHWPFRPQSRESRLRWRLPRADRLPGIWGPDLATLDSGALSAMVAAGPVRSRRIPLARSCHVVGIGCYGLNFVDGVRRDVRTPAVCHFSERKRFAQQPFRNLVHRKGGVVRGL